MTLLYFFIWVCKNFCPPPPPGGGGGGIWWPFIICLFIYFHLLFCFIHLYIFACKLIPSEKLTLFRAYQFKVMVHAGKTSWISPCLLWHLCVEWPKYLRVLLAKANSAKLALSRSKKTTTTTNNRSQKEGKINENLPQKLREKLC